MAMVACQGATVQDLLCFDFLSNTFIGRIDRTTYTNTLQLEENNCDSFTDYSNMITQSSSHVILPHPIYPSVVPLGTHSGSLLLFGLSVPSEAVETIRSIPPCTTPNAPHTWLMQPSSSSSSSSSPPSSSSSAMSALSSWRSKIHTHVQYFSLPQLICAFYPSISSASFAILNGGGSFISGNATTQLNNTMSSSSSKVSATINLGLSGSGHSIDDLIRRDIFILEMYQLFPAYHHKRLKPSAFSQYVKEKSDILLRMKHKMEKSAFLGATAGMMTTTASGGPYSRVSFSQGHSRTRSRSISRSPSRGGGERSTHSIHGNGSESRDYSSSRGSSSHDFASSLSFQGNSHHLSHRSNTSSIPSNASTPSKHRRGASSTSSLHVDFAPEFKEAHSHASATQTAATIIDAMPKLSTASSPSSYVLSTLIHSTQHRSNLYEQSLLARNHLLSQLKQKAEVQQITLAQIQRKQQRAKAAAAAAATATAAGGSTTTPFSMGKAHGSNSRVSTATLPSRPNSSGTQLSLPSIQKSRSMNK